MGNQTIVTAIASFFAAACPLVAASLSWAEPATSTMRNPPYHLADVVVRLEQTECYGSCPVYRIVVHGDGRVEYTGIQDVAATGERHGKISVDDVVEIINAFLRVRFFDLRDEYSDIEGVVLENGVLVPAMMYGATDLPTVKLSLQLGTRWKSVSLYDNYPAELASLAELVYRLARVKQWITDEK